LSNNLTAPATIPTSISYAQKKNQAYSDSTSNCITAPDRWKETYDLLPQGTQALFSTLRASAENHFKVTYPHIKLWSDLKLAESKNVRLIDIVIDTTMQRELDIKWVLDIVSKFRPTMVVPIQVYRDPAFPGKYIAWDGQHTLLALWVVAVILGVDITTIEVPVNIFQASLKKEIRENFVSLSTPDGKKVFEPIDTWRQFVFGVRIDGAKNPEWIVTEKKQAILEKHNLFVTSAKFGDEDKPGAIANIQEINRMPLAAVGPLARYLQIVCQGSRATAGTEIELMAHYFTQCVHNGITVTDTYVDDLAATALALYDADFKALEQGGKFWTKAKAAYHNWHAIASMNTFSTAKFSPHKNHGFPFLVAQMTKSMPQHRVPSNNSSSGFYPAAADLF
jgi:hypothetical protein